MSRKAPNPMPKGMLRPPPPPAPPKKRLICEDISLEKINALIKKVFS